MADNNQSGMGIFDKLANGHCTVPLNLAAVEFEIGLLPVKTHGKRSEPNDYNCRRLNNYIWPFNISPVLTDYCRTMAAMTSREMI